MNSSLISTWILTWLGLQSWTLSCKTLSWLNFFFNLVFKLNRILWSFSWLRLLDLNQLELLIIILLSLDLNRVLYLGISFGSNSFRSPPLAWTDPSYLIQIQLYSLLNQSCIKLMSPCTKRSLTWSKEVSLPCTFLPCPASLPESLLGRVTPYLISYPDAYLDSYPRLCPIPYLSHYPKPYPNRYLSHTRSFFWVLPGHVLDRVNPALPKCLPGWEKSYPITYLALFEAYPAK
jgi:hypothetical protein